jgi:hypothetical protein
VNIIIIYETKITDALLRMLYHNLSLEINVLYTPMSKAIHTGENIRAGNMPTLSVMRGRCGAVRLVRRQPPMQAESRRV